MPNANITKIPMSSNNTTTSRHWSQVCHAFEWIVQINNDRSCPFEIHLSQAEKALRVRIHLAGYAIPHFHGQLWGGESLLVLQLVSKPLERTQLRYQGLRRQKRCLKLSDWFKWPKEEAYRHVLFDLLTWPYFRIMVTTTLWKARMQD